MFYKMFRKYSEALQSQWIQGKYSSVYSIIAFFSDNENNVLFQSLWYLDYLPVKKTLERPVFKENIPEIWLSNIP